MKEYCYKTLGVRSLQFKNEIVSIGSGGGNIYFYDLRAAQYLPSQSKENELCTLQTSYGWVVSTYYVEYSGSLHILISLI